MHWRRKWQPTPVFLPGESQGQRSLVGCCLWGHTESDHDWSDLAAAAAVAPQSILSFLLTEKISLPFLFSFPGSKSLENESALSTIFPPIPDSVFSCSSGPARGFQTRCGGWETSKDTSDNLCRRLGIHSQVSHAPPQEWPGHVPLKGCALQAPPLSRKKCESPGGGTGGEPVERGGVASLCNWWMPPEPRTWQLSRRPETGLWPTFC